MTIKTIIYKLPNICRKLRYFFYKPYNRLLFKLVGIKYGRNLNVFNKIYLNIGNNSTIKIGDNFIFTSGESFNPLCRNIKGCIVTNPNASIIIGNNVGMSSSCIWSHRSITIGNHVNIGGDCLLMDSDAHSLNFLDRRTSSLDRKNKKDLPITIEDDVLIGTRCIILKGVTIGARSVVGSGSVVTKSIPANCIAAGNPCKVIRQNIYQKDENI